MRALITGGHGFVGRHLAQYLLRCGADVALTYLPLKPSGTAVKFFPGAASGEHPDAHNKVPLPTAAQSLALDIADFTAVSEVMKLLRPDVIFHLAGIAFVPDGEADGTGIFEVNTLGTFNVLEATRRHSADSRVLVVSSAEVYGEPRPGALPFTELSELRPVSAYGVSKAAADLLAFKYHYRDGMHTIRVRPFPHLGPGQNSVFAISSFARQIAEIKLGLKSPEIWVGNLESKRDYCDVSDIVRGYHEAALNGKPGEAYNLCSGESIAVGELLNILVRLAGVEVEIKQDPKRMRAIDIPELYGSSEKALKDFGWKPRVEREAMLDSLLAYWLDALSAK